MKTHKNCIEVCFDRGIEVLLEKYLADPVQRAAIMQKIRALAAGFDHSLPPPVHAREIYSLLGRLIGVEDPYLQIKDKSIVFARELYDSLQADLAQRPDRFVAAVRLSIAGNVIDFGANPDLTLEEAHASILAAYEEKLDAAAVAALKERMEHAQKILYILDNCGESVFDRLLIEPYAEKITIAVRGVPVLNDMTRREVAPSGLDLCPVVDTGDCTPGVSFPHSSQEFLAAYAAADLIIAKGQGNFETLEGLQYRDTAFLFRAKCPVVEQQIGCAHLSLQLIHENADPCKKNAIPGV